MKITFFLICIVAYFKGHSQSTIGLVDYQANNTDGYVLFSPMSSTETYLIDKCGQKVHEWNTNAYRPGLSSYLLEDGSLLRTGILDNDNFNEGGSGGIIERFNWNGNLTWSYTISNSDNCQHHDIKYLPNGNILVIVWDRYTNAEAIANGKNTTYTNSHLWSEKIMELQPFGNNGANVVWEWKLWDHLVQEFDNTKPNFGVVTDHPELVNINYFPGLANNIDWIHLNSIDYNPALDQILLSSHTLNEVWIIDHSTSTAEAATHIGGNSGKGGDLMYRWGNPQAYQRGTPLTKKFYGQHHVTWIPVGYPNAGKILIFNNGLNRAGTYSSIDMIETPIDFSNQYPIAPATAFLPASLFWTYTASIPADFYSSNISGVYPLSNSSFMITSGASGTFFEINSANETVWKYINPIDQTGILTQGMTPLNNSVFRCNYYPSSYPGFIGQTLNPLGEIELNPTVPSLCSNVLSTPQITNEENIIVVFPNPSSGILNIVSENNIDDLKITDIFGKEIYHLTPNDQNVVLQLKSKGVYFVTILSSKKMTTKKVIVNNY